MVVSLDTLPDFVAGGFVVIGVVTVFRVVWRYRATVGAVRRAEQASGTLHRVGIQPVRGGGSTAYVLAVEYTYQTPTQRLRGETVYPGGNRFVARFSTREAAQNALAAYEKDSELPVYYDPTDPGHAFLDREIQTGTLVGRLGFGGFLVVLGVLTALFV